MITKTRESYVTSPHMACVSADEMHLELESMMRTTCQSVRMLGETQPTYNELLNVTTNGSPNLTGKKTLGYRTG